MRSAAFLASAALGACSFLGPAHVARVDDARAGADSIVLERPAYRLSLTAEGGVSRLWRNARGPGRLEKGRIALTVFRELVSDAAVESFAALPDTIARDPRLCSAPRAGSPTATVTIFSLVGPTTVVDDLGCGAGADWAWADRLASLRALEAQIDSVAGTARWSRPRAMPGQDPP